MSPERPPIPDEETDVTLLHEVREVDSFLTFRRVRDIVLVRIDLETIINTEIVRSIWREIHQIVAEHHPRDVVINLRGVRFVSSAFQMGIVSLEGRLARLGCRLTLCCVPMVVLQYMRLLGLRDRFRIFGTQTQAILDLS